jgi:putative tricarboxylic transport membrane protein
MDGYPLAKMGKAGPAMGIATSGSFLGSITGILFNIPGRPSNAASLLDGHPLAQAGQARTAIGCAATASALGSTFGIAVLLLVLPVMQHMVLLFGPAEMLVLIVWGLTTIAAVIRGAILKGLAMAGIGLMLSFIGLDPRTAQPRYTFGVPLLEDGLSLVPVFLGMFALAELFALMRTRGGTISGTRDAARLGGSLMAGMGAVFRHWGLFLRSATIGTVIGMIPGVGGTVASFVAYGHAAQSARDKERFGKGDIRGLIAPEAANDAKDGGALVPVLAFGLPGGTGTAMLLAVLTLHGLEPGRELLSSQLTLVFVLIWSLFLSNWLTSLLGLATLRPLSQLTTIRTAVLVPGLIVVATCGAYLYRGEISDVLIAYLFAGVGFMMKANDWPRIPLVIALVLGPLFERNLLLVMRLAEVDRLDLAARPIVLLLAVMVIATLVYSLVRDLRFGPGPAERES